MDKEKYLELRKVLTSYQKLNREYYPIKYLLDNYARYFHDEASLKAFENIRVYLKNTCKIINTDLNRTRYKFQTICKHEILIKYQNLNYYTCPLCEMQIEKPNQESIIIESECTYPIPNMMDKAVNDIVIDLVNQDKDIITNFEKEFNKNKEIDALTKYKKSITLRRTYDKKRNH